MLDHLRKHTKLIIWLVVITFAGFGGFTVGTSFRNDGRVAGKVFEKPVYFQEYNLFERATRIFSSGPEPITDPQIVRLRTWQNIILSREAKAMGVEISDQEVKSEIARILAEQQIENPTMDLYRRWLKATINETPQDFEKQIRELLRIQKLVKQASESVLIDPTEEEMLNQFQRERNSLNLEMLRFESLEEAEAFYQKNPTPENWAELTTDLQEQIRTTGKIALDAIINLWQIPEERAFELLTMEIGAITSPTAVGKKHAVIRIEDKHTTEDSKFEEMRELYQQKISNYRMQTFLIEWGGEIQERAQLEDFLPAITQPEPDPVPAAPAPPEALANA